MTNMVTSAVRTTQAGTKGQEEALPPSRLFPDFQGSPPTFQAPP